MPAPRVSIALATYNGARYLQEQLGSFLAQTRLPDELVVGDDNSSDDTAAILERFAAAAPFPVRLTVNRPGLGPADNFAGAIARCTGDVVFLSDQDDLWRPDKIEQMLAFMAAAPGRHVVLHDAALIDAEGRALGLTMGNQLAASGVEPGAGLVAGCCMAFDGRLARLYDPAPATATHDVWLTATADLLGMRAFLPEPLIDYRRHGGNVSQSFMSDTRRTSRWARVRERIVRALGRPAGDVLAAAVADRQSALDALERCRAVMLELVPAQRLDHALACLRERIARDAARLAIHRAPRLRRPGLILRGLAAGNYSGGQGRLSLVRDAVDALRR